MMRQVVSAWATTFPALSVIRASAVATRRPRVTTVPIQLRTPLSVVAGGLAAFAERRPAAFPTRARMAKGQTTR